jgi:hypothetical protein
VKDKHFYLGAQRWTVRVVPEEQWADTEQGDCSGVKCLIRIRQAHPDVMRDTLLHELLHACLCVGGTDLDHEAEERVVRAIAPLLDLTLDWQIRGLE